MESNNYFDPEDWAIFQRSLLLLHSPDNDSNRKLYNLLQISIHKHHPTKKSRNDKFGTTSTKCNAFSNPEPIPSECQPTLSQHQQPNEVSKQTLQQEVKHFQGARDKTKSGDIINANLERGLSQISSTGQQIKKTTTANYPQSKTKKNNLNPVVGQLNKNEQSTLISAKKRVAHFPNKEMLINSKQLAKPLLKNVSRHSYCSSAVNLKKIRAVLARGDPFPTHLTKICINNITPDLQREKL